MGPLAVDEVAYDPREPAHVYAEGWQTWSPVAPLRLGDESIRAASDRDQKVMFRPGKPVPPGVIQAEGLLVIAPDGGPARAWFAPDPARGVPTLWVEARGRRALVSADGPVASLDADGIAEALAAVGERLRPHRPLRDIPAGWCSWSCYFKAVTEADVLENVQAARDLDVPVEVIQLDDGYETAIGDWLEPAPGFGSLGRMAAGIRSAGMAAGIWIPPFMIDPRSELARDHADWLVPELDAGEHWGVDMRILDVTRPEAAAHLRRVFEGFVDSGFTFFKLDFLYAGALVSLDAYRAGMELIRESVGDDAILLIGGAPLLPSIGLCDAMRVGPDVLPETPDPQPDVETLKRITLRRSWMNGRLWVNDPDHVVARPDIEGRAEWARHVADYGGVRFSGDRLASLDERGLELTRQVLSRRVSRAARGA